MYISSDATSTKENETEFISGVGEEGHISGNRGARDTIRNLKV